MAVSAVPKPASIMQSIGPRFEPGLVLGGKYILRGRIGEGGMGVVFLADQPALGRTVAIKILHPHLASNGELVARFRNEAVAASRVCHPRSVGVIECATLPDGTPYIVMTHIRGRSLGRVIAEEHVPLPRALDLAMQILNALYAVHTSGVVHADIKSDNFLVEDIDETDHVTLIDFGLARFAEQSVPHVDGSEVRVVSGTPEYMAPEIVRGEPPAPASDLYGAGVILYELLTGTTPFAGGSPTEIMSRQIDDVVIPPSLRQPDRDIPAALDDVLLRALHKQPEGRFANASEFAHAVKAATLVRRIPAPRPSLSHDSASPESPTRNCNVRPPPRSLARGSDCNSSRIVDDLRRAVGHALVRGDVQRIADGYAKLADALADERQFAAAVYELQEGIDVLTAGCGSGGADVPGPVDQLVGARAALYDKASERQARQLARHADHYPTLVGPAS